MGGFRGFEGLGGLRFRGFRVEGLPFRIWGVGFRLSLTSSHVTEVASGTYPGALNQKP